MPHCQIAPRRAGPERAYSRQELLGAKADPTSNELIKSVVSDFETGGGSAGGPQPSAISAQGGANRRNEGQVDRGARRGVAAARQQGSSRRRRFQDLAASHY